MKISADKTIQICPYKDKAKIYATILSEMMEANGINTKARICAFLAQIMHESGYFQRVQELASGREYEGRPDLGNMNSGDGERYKGRGLIQITGRSNYMKYGKLMGLDLLAYPKLLLVPENAVWSAILFWNQNKLSELADKGLFKKITKKINGGLHGYDDRLHIHEQLYKLLDDVG
jgi:putative chitinase